MIKISCPADHGNIDCLDAADPSDIRLRIRPDTNADFLQWFYFDVSNAAGQALTMRFVNANRATYLGGWKNYRAVASYDGEVWFLVDTAYDGEILTINHTPEKDFIQYAYFAPFPVSRHHALIEKIKYSPLLRHSSIGETLDGQAIDYFEFGEGARQCWVIARQHPGETMGSWWMEGFLAGLINGKNQSAQKLREHATLHIVPCMNLDGVRRGHLRTNAAGVDLNRAWRNTTMDKSPEVFLVREKMKKTGVDFFMDVHGDEAIANNFLDSAKNIPSWDERKATLFKSYSDVLLEKSEDFQTEEGYPSPAPGAANLDIATNYVGETWDCLSMTLEMPFKDAKVNPDEIHGWSPPRCRKFARAHIEVMAQILDTLR